jgi:succinate-acetate transporter protein
MLFHSGLISFASTTLLLSFVNVRARGVFQPNIIIGMGLAVGGLCQLLAGMWEFAAGNTFGATAFSSYGGFWISFALIFIPGTGIVSSLGADFSDALALYLATWFIFTFIMV